MVRLYLLGFTHDLKGVVFTQRRDGKTASFWVPIDDRFLAAVDKLERARRDRGRSAPAGRSRKKGMLDLNELPPASRSRSVALPPVGRSQARSGLPASEIQQMLREGRSAKTVAAAAKTPLAWVERLAEPVLTERMGVVRLAQRAYMHRPRLGTSGLQLGDAVQRNLEERRALTETFDDAAWDARARSTGAWRVWVRFTHRGKRRSAEWEFKKGSRQIVPRNRLAAQLGWWAPDPDAEPVATAEGEGEPGAEQTTGSVAPPATKPRPRAKRSRPASRTAKRRPARKKAAKPRTRRATARRRR